MYSSTYGAEEAVAKKSGLAEFSSISAAEGRNIFTLRFVAAPEGCSASWTFLDGAERRMDPRTSYHISQPRKRMTLATVLLRVCPEPRMHCGFLRPIQQDTLSAAQWQASLRLRG